MAIVSSTIIEDGVQADGRRLVTEKHVDDAGKEFLVHYMAEAGTDVSRVMSKRVATIEAQEAQRVVDEAEKVALEKEQATALLKLSDEDLAKALLLDGEDVTREKTELQERTSR